MQPGHTELISPSSRTAARRYIGNSRSQLAHRRIQGTGHLQHWLIRLRFYSADMLSLRRRGVAQVVAHQSGGLGVAGSSPVSPTSIEQCRIFGGCCTARPTLSRLSDAHDSELTDHPCQGRTASRGLSRAPLGSPQAACRGLPPLVPGHGFGALDRGVRPRLSAPKRVSTLGRSSRTGSARVGDAASVGGPCG